ncbi:MAG: SufD family Fe-S cluster assembly protein [Candidatus Delongbacteria bacterium]|nr:SufD family Fe-S cluster assembly protein [Candidatus Delongbacteria bacterium]MBN2834925.1 SufD family Fe-S cluster assembly protein [Candidatus Delongbacteria bacterium]
MALLVDKYLNVEHFNTTETATKLREIYKGNFPVKKMENWRYSEPAIIANFNIEEKKYINNSDFMSFISKDFYKAGIELNNIDNLNLENTHKSLNTGNDNIFHEYNLVSSVNNYSLTLPKNSSNSRVLLDMKENDSVVEITVPDHSENSISFVVPSEREFLNISILLKVGKEAKLSFTFDGMQKENCANFMNLVADLERESKLDLYLLNTGSKYSRNDVTIRFFGEGSEYNLNGLTFTENENQAHNFVRVEHREKNCVGTQLFKNILNDKAKISFDGLVHVFPGASKTDSSQMNANLMLSNDCRAYARPQLKIYNDDVSCTHGSNNGQLSQNELFYLKSRGMNDLLARSVLIRGFAGEILENVTDDIIRKKYSNYIEEKVNSWQVK